MSEKRPILLLGTLGNWVLHNKLTLTRGHEHTNPVNWVGMHAAMPGRMVHQ